MRNVKFSDDAGVSGPGWGTCKGSRGSVGPIRAWVALTEPRALPLRGGRATDGGGRIPRYARPLAVGCQKDYSAEATKR